MMTYPHWWSLARSSILLAGLVGACSSKTKATDDKQPTATAHTNIPNLPDVLFNYEKPDFPAHFSNESETRLSMQRPLIAETNTPRHSQITNAGVTLGRVLFYDENLSEKHVISCASCHKQALGFSDDAVFSFGFDGGQTKRHSMSLTNAKFYRLGRFFWDQRAATLEEQVLMPFLDPVEMGMTLEGLREQIGKASYYPPLFEQAFGSKVVTEDRIAKALAQFVRSLVSYSSKYDKGRAQVENRSDPFPNFSEQENHGKKLFSSPPPEGGFGCYICHRGEGFIAERSRNNGLDRDTLDPGYASITGLKDDLATFKVPSLRNVALRPPYMHDGRFTSLSQVINHYSSEVQPHPNLGPPFYFEDDGSVHQFSMSDEQKLALEAFLKTLSDHDFVRDPKFSNPFFPLPDIAD